MGVGDPQIVGVLESESEAIARELGDGLREGGVVAVDDQRAVGFEALDDAGVFVANAGEVAKAFEMLGRAIGDDGDVRFGDVREVGDFAGMIGAELQDEVILRRVGGEDGQGDADVVVEAFGRDRAAAALAKDGIDEMLGAGFAVAAGDGDDFPGK